MTLQEIIQANDKIVENPTGAGILIEHLIPHRVALIEHYTEEFDTSELVLIVTAVFNAAQYGWIGTSECLSELENSLSPEMYELVNFNSIMLDKL